MSTEISNDIKAKYGDSNGTFAASDLGLILTELVKKFMNMNIDIYHEHFKLLSNLLIYSNKI